MGWLRKKDVAKNAVSTASELADATITFGPAAILLILGAAAAGAAATYLVRRTQKKKKAAD